MSQRISDANISLKFKCAHQTCLIITGYCSQNYQTKEAKQRMGAPNQNQALNQSKEIENKIGRRKHSIQLNFPLETVEWTK